MNRFYDAPASEHIQQKLRMAASELNVADPTPFVGPLIDRTFRLPLGADEYAGNTLTPGAVPLEPSFSEDEPDSLRFTIVPLSPAAPAGSRRDEATREARRLVGPCFGSDALK